MVMHNEENKRETIVAFTFLGFSVVNLFLMIELAAVFLFLFYVSVFWLVFSRNPIVREGIDKFREAPAVFFVTSPTSLTKNGLHKNAA